MIYGYARVSTAGQASYGNSLEDQVERLRAAGCDDIRHDSYTGTKMDRPEFTALVGELKAGDRLVVTKLDRFARTTAGGIETIKELLAKGVAIHVLNMGLIDNTPTGRLIVTVLLAFAEFERDMIVERTSTGKAIARATKKGFKEGRPEKEVDEAALQRFLEKQRKHIVTVGEACAALGISRSTWYNRVRSTP